MSATRSFQLSAGRVDPRSVCLYLVYVECMTGFIELSSSYVSAILSFAVAHGRYSRLRLQPDLQRSAHC